MTIYEQIVDLKNTSSRAEVAEKISGLKESDALYQVLVFMLDKQITTKLKAKKVLKVDVSETLELSESEAFISAIKALKKSTGKDSDALILVNHAECIVKQQSAEFNRTTDFDNIVEILCKSYKLGVSTKIFTEAYPGSIVEHKDNLVLAKKIDRKKAKDLFGKELIITKKFDGIRCTVFKADESVKFLTRQGKEIEDLVELTHAFSQVNNGIYDGELLIAGSDEESYTSSDITKVTSTKGVDKVGLKFKCFDILEHKEQNLREMSYVRRLKNLNHLIKDKSELIEIAIPITGDYEPIIINDYDELDAYHKIAINDGWEGLMIALADGEYESYAHQCHMNMRDDVRVKATGLIKAGSARSNCLFKLKEKYTMDLLCVGVEIAIEGDNKGLIGAIIVDYKGNLVKVGSGLSEEDRKQAESYFKDKIIEVGYLALSTNQKDDKVSLKHPTYEMIRHDKTIADISYE